MTNDLQAAQAYLSAAMLRDPVLALANVVAWLNPLHFHQSGLVDDDIHYGAGAEDEFLNEALSICRHCFPEVYTQASQLIWQGADYDTLDRQICAGINRHLVAPLQELEAINEGVPIDARGVYLEEADFYDSHPDLAEVLAEFGIDADTFDTEFSFAQSVAARLMRSLEKCKADTLSDLACLLGWLFCATGNTLVDYTNSDIWENGYEPVDWTLENVAFVNDMTLEAIGMVASAHDAVQTLKEDDELYQALRRNIKIVSEKLKQSGEEKARVGHLRWPDRS
jgi:hypothetical protein